MSSMLGAREHKANSNAYYVSELLGTWIDLQMAFRMILHDSTDNDAISGEMEGLRGVSSISCGVSPAVQ